MAMKSAVARSMPAAPGATPRKILPPPITTATCTPSRTISPISATMRSITSRLMPYGSPPMSASPDSLSRTRLYAGSARTAAAAVGNVATIGAVMAVRSGSVYLELKASEAALGCLGHCRNLRRKIIPFLVDALADDVQLEPRYGCAFALEVFLDRQVGILDKRLTEQRHLGQELVDLPVDHLGDDVRRLSRLGGLRRVNRAFALDQVLGHLVASYADRTYRGDRRRDVHRDVLAGLLVAAFVRDGHANAAAPVQVLREFPRGRNSDEAADRHVLADFLHQRLPRILHRSTVERRGRERRSVGRVLLGDDLRQLSGERDEIGVAGHEIGFAVQLDHGSGLAVGREKRADHAFGGDAVRRLRRSGAAPDAEQLLSLRCVTAGFGQRLLAFHHGQPRPAAQVHHHACGNFRHAACSRSSSRCPAKSCAERRIAFFSSPRAARATGETDQKGAAGPCGHAAASSPDTSTNSSG